jgi:uncharacterized protein (DUF362 family)
VTMGYKRGSEPVVALVKSPSAVYEAVDFPGLLVQAVGLLEGAGIALPRSGTVFIKPNLVIPATAKESITTEPRFIAALIRLLLENGVGKVYVGESSASFIPAAEAFQISGMGEAVLQAGGAIVNIDDPSERVTLDMPGSDIVERISVPRKAWEADCLVNFSKVKTHRVGSFTCCVKNWVGLIDQQTRLEHHQSRLPKLVAELHRLLPEDVCFGDGVIAGEGDGPDLCRPRYLGALLASNDPVALDVIGAELLGVHRHDLVFPWTAHFEGVGEIDRNRIRLLGAHPQEIAIQIEKPLEVMYHRFPCNIVLGGMCEGCFAWFMGPALFWERDGVWEKINANVGKPTMMLGFNAVDRNFEKHLGEGPYFVIGNCTPARFQQDPRTVFIPGCCPGPRIPEMILKTCKVKDREA